MIDHDDYNKNTFAYLNKAAKVPAATIRKIAAAIKRDEAEHARVEDARIGAILRSHREEAMNRCG